MMNNYRPLLIAVLIASAVFLGSRLIPADNKNAFSPGSITGISKLNEVLNYISASYVDSVEKEELIEQGIESLLRDLDPHSYYIPSSRYKEMNEEIEGNFEGIGIEFRIISDTLMVIMPVAGGPSEKAGLKAGDRIVSVNDTIIAGKEITSEDVMKKLKGIRLSMVKVGVKRKGMKGIKSCSIVRDQIPLTSVQCFYMMDRNTGYVKVNNFSKTTYDEFKSATQKLLNSGMKSYILDLRGNPGGLLNEAIDMANEFLTKDKLIVYTEGKARPKKIYYANADGSLLSVKLVILIDEGSASASEVLAGAIQDNDRGLIVGRRSFGKGLVQEQLDWPDGSALRLTVARYYTPTGRSIQKPYKDVDNYHLETLLRAEHGEMETSDSIHVFDSLKYYTPSGRVVYGGGGIVPDFFIAVDSMNYNSYYNELYRKNTIVDFGFRYADSRRSQLLKKYRDWHSFRNGFKLSEMEFERFLQFASKAGVQRNPRQVARLRDHIRVDLKAQIARNLYGNIGYYTVVNQSDKALKVSLNLLQ